MKSTDALTHCFIPMENILGASLFICDGVEIQHTQEVGDAENLYICLFTT